MNSIYLHVAARNSLRFNPSKSDLEFDAALDDWAVNDKLKTPLKSQEDQSIWEEFEAELQMLAANEICGLWDL